MGEKLSKKEFMRLCEKPVRFFETTNEDLEKPVYAFEATSEGITDFINVVEACKPTNIPLVVFKANEIHSDGGFIMKYVFHAQTFTIILVLPLDSPSFDEENTSSYIESRILLCSPMHTLVRANKFDDASTR